MEEQQVEIFKNLSIFDSFTKKMSCQSQHYISIFCVDASVAAFCVGFDFIGTVSFVTVAVANFVNERQV
jgi:hypothetical protein